jgi:hypothetical protein
MRLEVLQIDSGCRSADCGREVTDMDIGKNVGFVLGGKAPRSKNARHPSWSISLFDGKCAILNPEPGSAIPAARFL